MPGANTRAIDKARTLPVDGIIIDFEDAVAPDAKAQARGKAVEAVRAGGFGHREVIIRINGLDTEWAMDDLNAAISAAPDGILIPKVATPDVLNGVGARLLDTHADHRIRIWAMLETPRAVLHAAEIAAASRDGETRLEGFVIGTNDLVKESRGRIVPGRAPLVPWLMTCVAAARAYGLTILDGVFNDLQNAEGLAAECRQGRDMGFDGKTLVHPNQIAVCNGVFSPDEAEIAEARKTIAAFELPENKGRGVVAIEGRMVERMHADMARRTVALADTIAAQENA
ncbi:MAG: citrate lyase subunit beta / citryl-CoA lyase [Variibacter sp.]|nr:citrate lyase subunit beta / citryl-CoA lyase [Variibacter sp.]